MSLSFRIAGRGVLPLSGSFRQNTVRLPNISGSFRQNTTFVMPALVAGIHALAPK